MDTQPAKQGWGKRAKWLPLAIACALAAWWLRDMLWTLLSQVLLGTGLACAMAPLCKVYERRLPRTAAALLSLLSLLVGVIALVTLLLPPLMEQINLLSTQLPPLIEQAQGFAQRIVERLEDMGLEGLMSGDVLQRAGQFSGTTLQGMAQQAGGIASAIANLSLAMVLGFYFVRDREVFLLRMTMLVPLAHRRRALLAAAEMRREVGGYLRGQLLVSLAIGFLTAIGLLLIGMPAWLALGVWMSIFDLVPYFGPFLGAVPVLVFSLSGGWTRILWAMGVVILAQQIENNLISPRVIGQSTGLHPVVVILALSAGGTLWGVWGMLVALPVVVAVRGALRVLRYREEMA